MPRRTSLSWKPRTVRYRHRRARITLAANASDSPLPGAAQSTSHLILDDSTSAIDSATEDEISAMQRLLRGRTTLLITLVEPDSLVRQVLLLRGGRSKHSVRTMSCWCSPPIDAFSRTTMMWRFRHGLVHGWPMPRLRPQIRRPGTGRAYSRTSNERTRMIITSIMIVLNSVAMMLTPVVAAGS